MSVERILKDLEIDVFFVKIEAMLPETWENKA